MSRTDTFTVLQMLPELESGGVERGTVELSAELVRRGHRSIVISGGGRLVEKLTSQGGEHLTWDVGRKSPWTLRWLRPLRDLLQAEAVDVLHVRSRVPAWLAWLAWRGLPQPRRTHFVSTAHGLYSVNRYSEIMTRGERVIAISQTVANYLKTNYPRLDAERIRVVYRGIDPAEFPYGYRPSDAWLQQWQAEAPRLVERPVIGLMGRITRCKGHLDFVEIIHRLKKKIPDVQGLIVGGVDRKRTGYATEVRQRVQELGLENVHFAGHRSDIRDLYTVCDAVLSLTSDPPEAFGRTTLEALCIGTPVIGYDHGGTGEILRKLFPTGVVAPGDIDGVVDRVAEVIERQIRPEEPQEFRREQMLQQTLDVYHEVVNGSSSMRAAA